MKFTRLTAFTAAFFLGIFSAAAQDDFGDFGDFGDFDDASSSSSGAAAALSKIKISGEVDLNARMYLDNDASERGVNCKTDDIKDLDVKAFPSAKLGFAYSGSNVDAEIKLKLNKDAILNYHWDLLDEASIKGYFADNKFTLEAGKMRHIWGKGDRVHVLDNFNADDYTDFLVPMYLDRRIAVPMVKASYAFDSNNMCLEAIWTPTMEADRFAKDGRWTPGKIAAVKNLVAGVLANRYAAAGANQMEVLAEANKYNSDASALYPDTQKLKYNQAGIRFTGTAGSFDFGFSYYYGHYKQVSANLSKYLDSYLATGSSRNLPEFDFDKKQTFGFEFATIIWHFNVRGEFAYNLTDDFAGDDPWVHNNSIQWLAGFDIDLPINNINLNVQETGTYILNNSKISDGDGIASYAGKFGAKAPLLTKTLMDRDVDYDKNGKYTNNRLIVNITDSWRNGKIKPEATIIWGIERGDLVVMPKIDFCPNQDITIYVNGLVMWGKDEDSEFADWSYNNNNTFVGLGVKCKF